MIRNSMGSYPMLAMHGNHNCTCRFVPDWRVQVIILVMCCLKCGDQNVSRSRLSRNSSELLKTIRCHLDRGVQEGQKFRKTYRLSQIGRITRQPRLDPTIWGSRAWKPSEGNCQLLRASLPRSNRLVAVQEVTCGSAGSLI